MKTILHTFILLFVTIQSANARTHLEWLGQFESLYRAELGAATACKNNTEFEYKVCSPALKNEGNAPYILHHGEPTAKAVVLFHGLSDSPFFFRSIAQTIHQHGHTVIVALLPGHGKLKADLDMEDADLAKRWEQHVEQVMSASASLTNNLYIGGFSTGGALATQYVLANPNQAKGMMLFSGALALDESVESMANIWGIKLLAKLLDGEYQTTGPNPYKYPSVAGHSAFMLTDVIFEIRDEIEQGNKPSLPIFVAHSMADTTTPWRGIQALLMDNSGPEVVFKVEESEDVCHADLVINQPQLVAMQYDKSKVEDPEKCSIPKANPKHADMLASMMTFLQQH